MPAPKHRALCLLAFAVVFTGCGRAPADLRSPADFWFVAEADGSLAPTLDADGAGDLVFATSGTAGLLIGADFYLKQRAVSVTGEVSAGDADRYGLPGPLLAPAGYEILLTQVATSQCSDWRDNGGAPVSRLAVGERTVELSDPLECGDLLAVVVPAGAPVALSVSTAGRSQTLNLRDGTRAGEVAEFYGFAEYVAFTGAYEASGDVTAKGVTRDVSLSLGFATASRGPWDRVAGKWAAEGKVWLRLGLTCSSNAYWGFSPDVAKHEPAVEWRLAVRDSYSLAVAGETVRPANDDVDDLSDRAGQGATCAGPVFEIPAGAGGATLGVHPDGPMRAIWSDAEAATRWSKPPAPAEYAVSFTSM
ncbi:hypothetical protein AB0I28_08075 [Phytomonospora sp. NPDC050363]|uniref:hypothetical protein n=1 Tax=Phytomonospora sp. NPDC050363 TaxID=3155642 RepID=UPI00340D7F66